MLGDFPLRQIAQAAFSASRAAVGAERKGGNKAATEIGAEIPPGTPVSQDLLGLGREPSDEILHLPAVLPLPGGGDQAVHAIDEGAVAPVDLGVTCLITAFPAERTHLIGSIGVEGEGGAIRLTASALHKVGSSGVQGKGALW